MKLEVKPECVDKIQNWIDSPFHSLLKKYMRHILDEESITYLSKINSWSSSQTFTDEEIEILEKIEKEIMEDY